MKLFFVYDTEKEMLKHEHFYEFQNFFENFIRYSLRQNTITSTSIYLYDKLEIMFQEHYLSRK